MFGEEPSVNMLDDKEVVKLIDSGDYHSFINFMMCGSDEFVQVIENKYFMNDNNDKFIMVLMQPGEVDSLPLFITLFAKSEVSWKQIINLSKECNINMVSDNENIYYVPYHQNVPEKLALNKLITFTEEFYKKNKE